MMGLLTSYQPGGDLGGRLKNIHKLNVGSTAGGLIILRLPVDLEIEPANLVIWTYLDNKHGGFHGIPWDSTSQSVRSEEEMLCYRINRGTYGIA